MKKSWKEVLFIVAAVFVIVGMSTTVFDKLGKLGKEDEENNNSTTEAAYVYVDETI